MEQLKIIYRNPAELKPSARNARTHSEKQIQQILRSIQSFGFSSPVLIGLDLTILCGHGRVEAAVKLGLKSIPTIELGHLSEAQRRAFMIADNRIAERSEWDEELLARELSELLDLDYSFEISDTGFDLPEIDIIIETLNKPASEPDEADRIISLDEVPAMARPGDLWLLGKHRLFCGDALDPLSYAVLLDGERAQMIFTDPPYNVKVRGHVSGLGKAKHPEFAMASGEMSNDDFTQFLTTACLRMAEASIDGSLHFICIDWRHLEHLIAAGKMAYSELKNLCCWVKSQGGMGSLYRSQHELVALFKAGNRPHVNNVSLGRHGRNRTNVWSYPGMNSFQSARAEKLAMHPTMKPVALISDAMLDCSDRGGLVLDPFGGSGTTLIAAQRAGRRGAAIEIDPRYVDVTLRRFCDVTGIEPVNAWTGATVNRRSPASKAA